MRARRHYHRILGLLLTLPLLWLCVTGVVLNHSADFRLDQRLVISPFLLSYYLEFPPEDEGDTFLVGTRTVSQWGELIFLDEQLLPIEEDLIGAIALGPNVLVATPDHLFLLGPNAEFIDSLDEASLPATPIQALRGKPTAILQADDQLFALDGELLDFPVIEESAIEFPVPLPLSDSLREELRQTLAAHTPVSYYRVLLDLHKFNFLGAFGKWVLTLSTVGLVALGVTGLMLYFKRKPGAHKSK